MNTLLMWTPSSDFVYLLLVYAFAIGGFGVIVLGVPMQFLFTSKRDRAKLEGELKEAQDRLSQTQQKVLAASEKENWGIDLTKR